MWISRIQPHVRTYGRADQSRVSSRATLPRATAAVGQSEGARRHLCATGVNARDWAVSAAAETRLAAVAMFRSVYASLGVRCDDVS